MKVQGLTAEQMREFTRRGAEAWLSENLVIIRGIEAARRLFPDIYEKIVGETVPLKTNGRRRTSGAKPRSDIGVSRGPKTKQEKKRKRRLSPEGLAAIRAGVRKRVAMQLAEKEGK